MCCHQVDSEFLVLAHGVSTDLIRDLEHEHRPMHRLLIYLPGTLLNEDSNKKSGQGGIAGFSGDTMIIVCLYEFKNSLVDTWDVIIVKTENISVI